MTDTQKFIDVINTTNLPFELNYDYIMAMFDKLSKAPTLLDAFKIVTVLIDVVSQITNKYDVNLYRTELKKYNYIMNLISILNRPNKKDIFEDSINNALSIFRENRINILIEEI
jgi:hypothetical protein